MLSGTARLRKGKKRGRFALSLAGLSKTWKDVEKTRLPFFRDAIYELKRKAVWRSVHMCAILLLCALTLFVTGKHGNPNMWHGQSTPQTTPLPDSHQDLKFIKSQAPRDMSLHSCTCMRRHMIVTEIVFAFEKVSQSGSSSFFATMSVLKGHGSVCFSRGDHVDRLGKGVRHICHLKNTQLLSISMKPTSDMTCSIARFSYRRRRHENAVVTF